MFVVSCCKPPNLAWCLNSRFPPSPGFSEGSHLWPSSGWWHRATAGAHGCVLRSQWAAGGGYGRGRSSQCQLRFDQDMNLKQVQFSKPYADHRRTRIRLTSQTALVQFPVSFARSHCFSQDNHRVLQCPNWQLQERDFQQVPGSLISFFKDKLSQSSFFVKKSMCKVILLNKKNLEQLKVFRWLAASQDFTQRPCSVLAGLGGSGFLVPLGLDRWQNTALVPKL